MVRYQKKITSKSSKPKKKKYTRFKLLLDEGLFPTNRYKQLSNFHELHHVKYIPNVHEDIEIFEYAKKNDLNLIVFNKKHFRKLLKATDNICLFLVDANTKEKDIDNKIAKVLRNETQNTLRGKSILISRETGKKSQKKRA